MAATLYRDTGYSLTHLIEDIKHGNIALPDIQRPFVWKSSKARDLFDSMYKGFPVGTLMFWETGADVGTRQVGGGEREKVARLLIVDGQQRLTSLYAVLTGERVLTKTFEERRISLAFNPSTQAFEVTDAAIKKDPEFLPDITALWDNGYRPTVRHYLARLADSRGAPIDQTEEDQVEDAIDRVFDLQNFRFQVVELNMHADEEQVAEIFVRINSEGVKLNQADFILTLLSVHWEKGRRELEGFCRDSVDPSVTGPSPKNPFIEPTPDQLLRAGVGLAFRRGRLQHVYSILRGKDLDTGELSTERRESQFAALERAQDEVLDLTNWHEYLKCITHAGFRSGKMLTSETALIYTYVLYLVGKRDFGLNKPTLRSIISRWFFMAHTTRRYTSSPESSIEADLGRISALDDGDGDAFVAELDRLIASNFTGDFWDISMPNMLDTSAARSPALSAYWAALNLLDAELLFSNLRMRELMDPNVLSPRSIERHHLFPKAFLKDAGVTDRKQVNAIANMAFLDWPDNASIGATDPLDYWPKMIDTMDAERLRSQQYWHALPVGWEQLDYATFVERRRDLIAKVVRKGFSRLADTVSPVQPSSQLQDLLEIGESQTIEFKSTARWNVRANIHDKKMEHAIAKTVCGFLNSEGGVLLIGVDDDSNVLGLEKDLQTLGSKSNIDGYELFLRQHLDNTLSVQTAATVKIRFESASNHDICVVSVAASGRPVFTKPPEGGAGYSEFWVRIGNATKQLHGDDMMDYRIDHWG